MLAARPALYRLPGLRDPAPGLGARGQMINRTAAKQVGSIAAFGVIPAAAVVLMFVVAWHTNSLAVDFRNEIYPEAKQLLSRDESVPRTRLPP